MSDKSLFHSMTKDIVEKKRSRRTSALIEKWEEFGLLEGMKSEQHKQNMALVLENQAEQLLQEATSMGGGNIQGYASSVFPIVRRVFGNMVAQELVSVQAMELPSGLIHYLDFTFGRELGGPGDVTSAERFGNKMGGTESIYGTDKLGPEIAQGVNILGPNGEDLSGPYNLGSTYSSPTGSVDLASDTGNANVAFKGTSFALNPGTLTDAQRKAIRWDVDLLDLAESSPGTHAVAQISVAKSLFVDGNFDVLNAFVIPSAELAKETLAPLGANARVIRRLTTTDPSDSSRILFTVSGLVADVPVGVGPGNLTTSGPASIIKAEYPRLDHLENVANSLGSVVGGDFWGLELNEQIPEIDLEIKNIPILAKTKKLKTKWTTEAEQDLNAYHNLDAQKELTQVMSEYMTLEIDQEILQDLVQGASKGAGIRYWSRSPGLFLDAKTGAEIGASAKAPDFTGNVSEWYQTLLERINDISAIIQKKTLRGGANFIVIPPEIASILEFTSAFRASVTSDVEKGLAGAVKTGELSKKWDVYVSPYFPSNLVLVGRKGSGFLESGYVYAPYVPMQTSPVMHDPETFQPRKSIATRYGKKMVRPDMYGLVVVRGLNGESGGA